MSGFSGMLSSGMSAIGNLWSSDAPVNQATLTGALDVIAVEYDSGEVRSTPFHVRFGKFKVFRSRDKVVKLFVNDEEIKDVDIRLGDAGEAYFIYTQDEDKEAVKATKSVSMGELPSRTSAPPTPTRPLPGAGPSRPGTAMLRSASLPSLAGQDRPASPPTDPDNHTGPPSSLASSMTSEEAAPEQRAPADTAAGGGGVMSWVWGWGKLPHSQTTTDRPVARAHRSLLLDTATGAAVREGPAGAAQRLGSAPSPRRKFRRHSTGGLLRSGPLVRATLPRIVQGLVQGVQGGGLPPLATSHSTLARACVALSKAVAGAAAQGSALQPAAVHDVANALTQLLSALAPRATGKGAICVCR